MRLERALFATLLLLNQSVHLVSFNFVQTVTSLRSTSSALYLNRIFCDLDEVIERDQGHGVSPTLILNLNTTDYRCKHINTILRLEAGDTLKGGIIGIGSTDNAQILEISKESGVSISLGPINELYSNERPLVDMILAVPRPLRLERILSVISCIGVGSLVLTGAAKVQNDYFGSHLFRRADELKKCLVEGISQSSVDCFLPEVLVRKNFEKFIVNEIDTLYPSEVYHRVVAHPPSVTIDAVAIRINQLERTIVVDESTDITVGKSGGEVLKVVQNESKDVCDSLISNTEIVSDGSTDRSTDISSDSNIVNSITSGIDLIPTLDSNPTNSAISRTRNLKKIVVAVGPEGGWEDDEVKLLLSKGFRLVSLGPRILRTDMAVSVLLGLAHEWTDNIE